jgi:hypothetical protein
VEGGVSSAWVLLAAEKNIPCMSYCLIALHQGGYQDIYFPFLPIFASEAWHLNWVKHHFTSDSTSKHFGYFI